MDFDEVCKHIGKLYLEKENIASQARQTVEDLNRQLGTAIRERDEAVKLINAQPST